MGVMKDVYGKQEVNYSFGGKLILKNEFFKIVPTVLYMSSRKISKNARESISANERKLSI